jgi:hypothetical protein
MGASSLAFSGSLLDMDSKRPGVRKEVGPDPGSLAVQHCSLRLAGGGYGPSNRCFCPSSVGHHHPDHQERQEGDRSSQNLNTHRGRPLYARP